MTPRPDVVVGAGIVSSSIVYQPAKVDTEVRREVFPAERDLFELAIEKLLA
ncbi:MAG TPA: hypothetical protein VF148_18325 [Acidimicrobiia bacterium]